jgi:hypothetical protein
MDSKFSLLALVFLIIFSGNVFANSTTVTGSTYACNAGGSGSWCGVPATCSAWTLTYTLPACTSCFVESVTHTMSGYGQSWVHTGNTGYNRYYDPSVNFFTRYFTAGATECDLGGGSTFDRDYPYDYSGSVSGNNGITPSSWGSNKDISYSCLTNATSAGLLGGSLTASSFSIIISFHVGETTITLNSPADLNKSTLQNNTFNFSFNSQGYNVTNCTLFTNQSGSWTASQDNQSVLLNGTSYGNYISYNFSKDGDFLWGVVCTDTAHSSTFYSANRTLSIDSTAPHDFSFVSPTESDGAIINYSWVYVNASVNDSHLDSCWVNFSNGTSSNYSLSVGASSSFVHYTYANFTSQPTGVNITYIVYCNDSFGNTGSASARSISIGYLNISLNSPADVNKTASQNNTFNFTPNTAFNAIVNCSLFSNSSGAWSNSQDNQSSIVNASPNYISFNFTKDGDFLWGVVCYNNESTAFWSVNRSISIDSASPNNFSFVSPTQNDGAVISFDWVYMNMTFNETHNDSCWFQVSNGSILNYSATSSVNAGGLNYAFLNFSNQSSGTNVSWILWCNDSFGNTGYSVNRSVFVNTAYPSVTLVSPLFGASTTDTAINFTFNVSSASNLANATLYHNCNGSAWNAMKMNESVVSKTSVNGIYFSPLIVTSCVWNIYSCDALGRCSFNPSNYTLTITAPVVPPAGGGGGGGGVITSYFTVLPDNFTESLPLFSKKDYVVEVKNIYSAPLTISITPSANWLTCNLKSITLDAGKTQEVTITAYVNSGSQTGQVVFEISSPVVARASADFVLTGTGQSNASPSFSDFVSGNALIWWIVVIVLLVIALILYLTDQKLYGLVFFLLAAGISVALILS